MAEIPWPGMVRNQRLVASAGIVITTDRTALHF